MVELPEQLQRDLATLRSRADPPAGAEQRVLASLEAVGFDGDPDPSPEPHAPTELGAEASDVVAQLVWAGKIVAVTLALTGAGLLAVRGAVVAARAISGQPTHTITHAEPQPNPPPSSRTLAPNATPSRAPTVAEPEPATPALEPERTRASRPPVEPQPTDTLAAELALIESARTHGDPTAALDQLRRHTQQFPHGELATERELLVIENLCELGRFEQARARERSLADVHGDSPQLGRLRKLCPELSSGTDRRRGGHD